MEKNILQTKKTFKVLDSLNIIFGISPIASVVYIILQILGNAIGPISVYISANFMDQVYNYLMNDTEIKSVFISLIPMLICLVLDWTWFSFQSLCEAKLDNHATKLLNPLILKQKAQLDYQYFEDESTSDLLKRIETNSFLSIFRDVVTFCGFCVKILGVIGIVFTNVWWAAILIIVFFIPTIFVANKSGKANYKANIEITKNQRKAEYLGDVLENRDAAAERTLFRYGKKIGEMWEREYNYSLKNILKTKICWDIRQRVGSLSIIILTFIIMLLLLFPTLDGKITIGLYIALVGNCSQLAFKMQWMFIGKLESISKDREYCRDFTEFMNLSINKNYISTSSSTDEFYEIEFKNVSFTYPGTEIKVLDDISFKLEAGKHYAFVGYNGSGKSTIIKLLTGLYRPDSGKILLNGQDIQTLEYQKLVSFFSIVYQDFARYNISIRDNLNISNITNKKTDDELDETIKKLGLFEYVHELKDGYDTKVGKVYENGIDMSGGEWQKIVLARALNRQGQLFILDEPTAALSPKAESMLYEQFGLITKDKTTLFISHRLGSTKLADVIYVIDEGVIKEQGGRDELLKKGGLYYEMFNAQKNWYE